MLTIGMPLTLEPLYSRNSDEYRSKVVEMSATSIYIDYPVNSATDKTTFLVNGTRLKVTFTLDNRDSFTFETEVKGRVKGEIPMISLFFPEADAIFKIQRRQYVRVEAAVDIAVKKNNQFYHFISVDLSAGGLSFILRQRAVFEKDEEMDLFLVLPMKSGENQYVKVRGKFIRTKDRNGAQIASVNFIEATSMQQQQIMRYTFERQLSLKQKDRVM
ncbi:flagellar brake protein [Jeotgalibacillus proteolyticus]|uniref:flagellar brake protein n=1 Tax=Jeotgalibacillus proteolyticus TaxID=2082395 RepID=UPI003CEF1D65